MGKTELVEFPVVQVLTLQASTGFDRFLIVIMVDGRQ